jgi:hypothetical protein
MSSEKRCWRRHLKACKHAITINEGLIKLSPKSSFSHGQLYVNCGEFYMPLRFGMWNTNKIHFRYIPFHWMSPFQIVMWDVNKHDNAFLTSPFQVKSYTDTQAENATVTGRRPSHLYVDDRRHAYLGEGGGTLLVGNTTNQLLSGTCRKSLLTSPNWFTNMQLKNSAAWVRERTIPTQRPPLVGEVTANFYG